jgi:hypothetical protein
VTACVFDRHGCVAGEQRERLHVPPLEAPACSGPDAHEAHQRVLPQDRDAEHGMLLQLGPDDLRQVPVAGHQYGLPREQHAAGQAHAGRQAGPELLLGKPVDRGGLDHVVGLVVEADRSVGRADQLAGQVQDPRQQRAQRKPAADRLDDGA